MACDYPFGIFNFFLVRNVPKQTPNYFNVITATITEKWPLTFKVYLEEFVIISLVLSDCESEVYIVICQNEYNTHSQTTIMDELK